MNTAVRSFTEAAPSDPLLAAYATRRVLHETRFRTLQVLRTAQVTPRMRRITLGGPDLEGFVTQAFDNHVKLAFASPDAAPGAPLALPSMTPNGPVWPEGPRPALRDYSLRRFDPVAGELDIDFVLHDAGPATAWAAQAVAGQSLTLGGPRGSFVVPVHFDWHLLVGDETALPAIGRRLAELPATTRAIVLCEVADAGEQQALPSAARSEIHWLHRDGAAAGSVERLGPALDALILSPAPGFTWIACEGQVAKALRQRMVEAHGQRKEWLKAAAYWHREGAAAGH